MLKETKIVDRFTKQRTSKRGLLDFDNDGNSTPKSNSINRSYDNLNKEFGKPSLFSEQKRGGFPGLKRIPCIKLAAEDQEKDKEDKE